MKEKLLALTLALLLSGCGGGKKCPDGSDGSDCPKPTTPTTPTTNDGDFIFPFSKGQTWVICQGYNTPDISRPKGLNPARAIQGHNTPDISHHSHHSHHGDDIHALDISYDLSAANGPSGCDLSSANASAGQMVYAPADGNIAWYGLDDIPGIGIDVACITLHKTASNGAKSVMLGHLDINDFVSKGDTVKQGALLGRVNTPSTRNGNYAHIHISTYDNELCAGKSLPLNDVFGGTCNFTSDGSKAQWRGTQVTAPE